MGAVSLVLYREKRSKHARGTHVVRSRGHVKMAHDVHVPTPSQRQDCSYDNTIVLFHLSGTCECFADSAGPLVRLRSAAHTCHVFHAWNATHEVRCCSRCFPLSTQGATPFAELCDHERDSTWAVSRGWLAGVKERFGGRALAVATGSKWLSVRCLAGTLMSRR